MITVTELILECVRVTKCDHICKIYTVWVIICKCKTLIITQWRSPEVERKESHMRLREILRRLSDRPAAHF